MPWVILYYIGGEDSQVSICPLIQCQMLRSDMSVTSRKYLGLHIWFIVYLQAIGYRVYKYSSCGEEAGNSSRGLISSPAYHD